MHEDGVGLLAVFDPAFWAVWTPSLAAAPRERWAPVVYEPVGSVGSDGEAGTWTMLTEHHQRPDRPGRLEVIRRGGRLVTQLDGATGIAAGWQPLVAGTPTSALPSLMTLAVLLRALDPQPGDHVLEAGTGSGHSAAVLAHRLGDGQVSSLEIDPRLAAAAADRAAGGAVTGAARPIIVAADATAGLAACLTVTAPGAAQGRFLARPAPEPGTLEPGPGPVWEPFIADRADPATDLRPVITRARTVLAAGRASAEPARSRTVLGTGWHEHDPFAVALAVGGYHTSQQQLPPEHDDLMRWLIAADGSWVLHRTDTVDEPGPPATNHYQVHQSPGRLWDRIVAAAHAWDNHGRPAPERYGLTATTDTTTTRIDVWLDDPAQVIGELR